MMPVLFHARGNRQRWLGRGERKGERMREKLEDNRSLLAFAFAKSSGRNFNLRGEKPKFLFRTVHRVYLSNKEGRTKRCSSNIFPSPPKKEYTIKRLEGSSLICPIIVSFTDGLSRPDRQSSQRFVVPAQSGNFLRSSDTARSDRQRGILSTGSLLIVNIYSDKYFVYFYSRENDQ